MSAQRKPKAASESPATGGKVDMVAQSAAIWGAISKVAGKEFSREHLPGGVNHTIDIHIAARVDGGQVWQQDFTAMMSVGFDSERASSSACDQGKLLALLLAKLNTVTREKFLRETIENFAANGNELPEAPAEVVEDCDRLLSGLRSQKQTSVKGSVSVKHLPAAQRLAIFG